MFQLKVICITLSLALLCGLSHADIVYDESVDGDLSNFESSPTAVTLAEGGNQLLGTIGGTSNPNIGDGFDSLVISIGANQTLTQIIINDYQVSGGNTSTGVNIFTSSGTFLGSVAMNTSDVGSDLLRLTGAGQLGPGDYRISLREFTAPGQTYDFSFVVVVPEPVQAGGVVLFLTWLIFPRNRRRFHGGV